MPLSRRMAGVQRSYIREILKVTARPEVISFAGGLPLPDTFPTAAVAQCAAAVLAEDGAAALQYSTTEGHPPLRQRIAQRLNQHFGGDLTAEDVLITTGSQQGLDLAAKILLDPGDGVVIERPAYLGAIQPFSLFQASFRPVALTATGLDTVALEAALAGGGVKLLYMVPNFQNPSGLTYSLATRRRVAELAREYDIFLVEDDPYGELRFQGEPLPPVRSFAPERTILLGSFSKVVAPGLRVGYAVAPPELLRTMVTAKQAADLHTSSLDQRIVDRFLASHDLDAHLDTIRQTYGRHRDLMLRMIRELFPPEVAVTEPEGGMFLWLTLPAGLSARRLFDQALACNVAFVPGRPFYVEEVDNTLRLNFSNSTPERIAEGMRRLATCLGQALAGPD